MRIVPVSVRLKGKATHTYSFVDSGSSTGFMSKKTGILVKCQGKTKQITLNTLEKLGLKNRFKLLTIFLQSDIFQCKNCITNQDFVKWSHCPR